MLKCAVSGSELACCVAVNHNVHMEAANFTPPTTLGLKRLPPISRPWFDVQTDVYITVDVLTDLHTGTLGSGVLPCSGSTHDDQYSASPPGAAGERQFEIFIDKNVDSNLKYAADSPVVVGQSPPTGPEAP